MTASALEFVIPGDLQSATGGNVYDRAVAAGLRALGWTVTIHGLGASFPHPTPEALMEAERVFSRLADGACVLVDGLALGAIPDIVESHKQRLKLVALIHMPLALEIGITADVAERSRQQELRALRAVRHVIVTSEITARELAMAGIDPALMSVVEPGIDAAASPATGSLTSGDVRTPGPGQRAHAVKLLCVATIHDGKGHEILLDALGHLVELPWHLQCVGSLERSPSTVLRIRKQIRQLYLDERVTLVGEVPHTQLGEYYWAADIFVLPTLRETYCMAVAEALAHGLPVISTRTGAIPELVGSAMGTPYSSPVEDKLVATPLIQPSVAGLLTDPGDGEALRAALERVLTDESLRTSLRSGALAARERLTPWTQACAYFARVLRSVR